MTNEANEILEQAFDQEISIPEALGYLEELEIHGTFTSKGYVGYDYNNQQWLKVEA